MPTLLDDLKIGIARFLYTIDDCYAQNSLLNWQSFLPELNDEFVALEKQVGRQRNGLELVQKYYHERVNNASMLKANQLQITESENRLQSQQTNTAAAQSKAQVAEQAAQTAQTQLTALRQQLNLLENKKNASTAEQKQLEILAENGSQEKDYKKIIKKLSEEIEQAQADMQKTNELINQTETELWRQRELITQAKLQIQQSEQAEREIQQQLLQFSTRQHAATNNDDFLTEKAAFAFLEPLFKTALRFKQDGEDYSEATGEEFIVNQPKVPKLWKNILTNLLNEPIPAVAGALKKKKKGAIVAHLERYKEVKASEDLLAASFLGLKKHILSKTENWAVQTVSEYLYLPLSAGIYAKIRFREKGRFIQSFAKGENGTELEIFINLHEQAATDNAQSHTVHAQLTVQTVQDLYILYDKYVIEMDFRSAAVLL